MRKLLILFFLLIIAVAGANNVCSYGETVELHVVDVNSGNYTYSCPGTVSGAWREFNKTSGITINDYYITQLTLQCTANCISNVFESNIKVLDSYGNCTVTPTIYTGQTGLAGAIYDANNELVGSFTAYYTASSKMLYLVATYSKYTYKFPLRFVISGEWTTATHCAFLYNNYYFVSLSPTLPDPIAKVKTYNSGTGTYISSIGVSPSLVSCNGASSTINYYVQYNTLYNFSTNFVYDANKNILSFTFYNNTNQNKFIVSYNGTNYTLQSGVTLNLSATNNTLTLYDYTTGRLLKTYNLIEKLECFPQTPQEPAKIAYLRVKTANGIMLEKYKIYVQDYNVEKETTNGVIDLSEFVNQTITLEIKPEFLSSASENITLSVTEGENIVTLSSYFYAVTLRVYYSNLQGYLLPISFNYNFAGDVYPDKTNYRGFMSTGGTAFANITKLLPAGYYNLTVNTTLFGFERSAQKEITLMDNIYYRFYTVKFDLVSSSIEESSALSAMLTVLVENATGKKVDNATVKLFDVNWNKKAEQFTVNGQTTFANLTLYETYYVQVYYKGVKKAEQSVKINYPAEVIKIVVDVDVAEETETGEGLIEEQAGRAFNIINNPAIWGLVIVIALAIVAAANAGERIGLITFVAALGVFTYIIPLLPQVIFIVVAIIAMILFSWKIAGRFVGGGEE